MTPTSNADAEAVVTFTDPATIGLDLGPVSNTGDGAFAASGLADDAGIDSYTVARNVDVIAPPLAATAPEEIVPATTTSTESTPALIDTTTFTAPPMSDVLYGAATPTTEPEPSVTAVAMTYTLGTDIGPLTSPSSFTADAGLYNLPEATEPWLIAGSEGAPLAPPQTYSFTTDQTLQEALTPTGASTANNSWSASFTPLAQIMPAKPPAPVEWAISATADYLRDKLRLNPDATEALGKGQFGRVFGLTPKGAVYTITGTLPVQYFTGVRLQKDGYPNPFATATFTQPRSIIGDTLLNLPNGGKVPLFLDPATNKVVISVGSGLIGGGIDQGAKSLGRFLQDRFHLERPLPLNSTLKFTTYASIPPAATISGLVVDGLQSFLPGCTNNSLAGWVCNSVGDAVNTGYSVATPIFLEELSAARTAAQVASARGTFGFVARNVGWQAFIAQTLTADEAIKVYVQWGLTATDPKTAHFNWVDNAESPTTGLDNSVRYRAWNFFAGVGDLFNVGWAGMSSNPAAGPPSSLTSDYLDRAGREFGRAWEGCDSSKWLICPGTPGHPAGEPHLPTVGSKIVGSCDPWEPCYGHLKGHKIYGESKVVKKLIDLADQQRESKRKFDADMKAILDRAKPAPCGSFCLDLNQPLDKSRVKPTTPPSGCLLCSGARYFNPKDFTPPAPAFTY